MIKMLAVLSLMIQAPISVLPDSWMNQAEHLTLSGAMVIAIAILWKSLQSKDALLIDGTRAVTQALAAAATSNLELREIIKESVMAKQDLLRSIELLRASISIHLPCILPITETKKPL